MKKLIEVALSVWIGCTAYNFIAQALGDGNWSEAISRSIFQFVPLAVFIGVLCFSGNIPASDSKE